MPFISVFFEVAAALLLAQVAQACNLVERGTNCSALSEAFGFSLENAGIVVGFVGG
jgi:hypothetical protein